MITGARKKKPIIVDNIQKLIDSAGETQFKNIYKNLQVEIKDKIITKLLSKLNILNKQIEDYKNEITSLKNDLVYLLKRVILSKNEEDLNKKINFNKLYNNNSTKNNNLKNAFLSPMNNTISQIKPYSNIYNQTYSNNNYYNNKIGYDNSNLFPVNAQNELDIKINNYINSIYKKNFLKNDTNINEYYSLNKKENLFNEIFHKKNNLKYSENYLSTEPLLNNRSPLSHNRSQRNISASLIKRPLEPEEEKRKQIKFSSSMVNIKNKKNYINYNNFDENQEENEDDSSINKNEEGKMKIVIKNNNTRKKSFNVKKKSGDLNLSNKQLNNYKSFKNKTQHNGFHSTANGNKINFNSGKKKKNIKNNNNLPLNRSPLIPNKV